MLLTSADPRLVNPTSPWRLRLTGETIANFSHKPTVANHRLQGLDLFSDAALIELLDNFPRERLFALSMGTDPRRSEENRLALHDGVSGAELLRAVKQGRLWLNITRVDQADHRYRELIQRLYTELSMQIPDFFPDAIQSTLLISSPDAMVYYHADGPATILWHLRGRKRIWVYPADDERYLRREHLEDIIAGVRHEYLPYATAFDDAAQVFDLEPGQWITWPQNAPHRVSNLGSLNVSLATEHFTAQSKRRARVHMANRFLRQKLGVRNPSQQLNGGIASGKILLQRAASRLGLDPTPPKQHNPSLQVDANAPGGVAPLACNSSLDKRHRDGTAL